MANYAHEMFQSDQTVESHPNACFWPQPITPHNSKVWTLLKQSHDWVMSRQKVSQIPIFQVFPNSKVLTTHGNDVCWLLLPCGRAYWVRLFGRLEYYSISYHTRERMPASGLSQLPFLNRDLLGHYCVYKPYMSPQAHGTTLGHFTIWRAQANHT